MRVLVCGGREYKDRRAVFAALDFLHAKRPISCLINGVARGADSLGRDWAIERHVPHADFAITQNDWEVYGNSAGPIRNMQMLEDGKPELVVAFPGGPGTRHMVRIATEAGVKIWQPMQTVKYVKKAGVDDAAKKSAPVDRAGEESRAVRIPSVYARGRRRLKI